MYNITNGFKQFTSMMAYDMSPVTQIISFIGNFGIESGIITVGVDGCICVWAWKKPVKSGGRGRGRGRGKGRYFGGQGDQGRGF